MGNECCSVKLNKLYGKNSINDREIIRRIKF